MADAIEIPRLAEGNLGTLRLDASRIAWRRVGDELVVLDLKDSSYLSVNESGAVLWTLLEQGATTDQLVQLLLDEFEVEPDVARTETDVFVEQLASRGLLLPEGES